MNSDTDVTTLTITLTPELADALDRYIVESGLGCGRDVALMQAFRDWATSKGLVDTGDDGLRPEQLNAANDG